MSPLYGPRLGAADVRFAVFANLGRHWLFGPSARPLVGFHLGLGALGLWYGFFAGLAWVAILLFVRFLMIAKRPIARV